MVIPETCTDDSAVEIPEGMDFKGRYGIRGRRPLNAPTSETQVQGPRRILTVQWIFEVSMRPGTAEITTPSALMNPAQSLPN